MKHRVRAIISDGDKILTIKRVKKDITYFVFPGGGVEQGEDLKTAIIRECKEELGVIVEVNDEFASERFDRDDLQQLEHFYFCNIISGELGTGNGPEYNIDSEYEGTHEIEWISVNDLNDIDLRPSSVKDQLKLCLKK